MYLYYFLLFIFNCPNFFSIITLNPIEMANILYENLDNIISVEIREQADWQVIHKPACEYKVIDKKERWWRKEVSHMENRSEKWIAMNPKRDYWNEHDLTLHLLNDSDHLDVPSSRTKIKKGRVYVDSHLVVNYAIGKSRFSKTYYFLSDEEATQAAVDVSVKSNSNLHVI
jgi:hypothetical protein